MAPLLRAGDFYDRHGDHSKAISAYGEYIARIDTEPASTDRDARQGAVHKKMGSLFLALHQADKGAAVPPAVPAPSSSSYLQSAMKHYDAAMMLGAYDRDVRAFYASQAVLGTSSDSSVSEESPVSAPNAATAVKKTSGAGGINPSMATNPASPTTLSIRTSRWVIKSDPNPPLSEDTNRHTSMGGSMDMKMGGGSMGSLLRSVEESMQPMQTASTAFEQMVRQQEALQQE